MKKETQISIAITILAVLLIGLVSIVVSTNQANKEADRKIAAAKAESDKQLREAEAKAAADLKAKELENKKQAEDNAAKLAEQAKIVADLKAQIAAEKNTIPSVVTVDSVQKYVKDELSLGGILPTMTLSDTKLAKLQDGKIEFDGDNYDFEEVVTYAGLVLDSMNSDYKGQAYLEVPENGITYEVKFDKSLPTSKIGVDDNYLTVSILGQERVIESWDGDKIIFTSGNEVDLKEEESIVIDNKDLTLEFVSETGKVIVSYNGETKTVIEGQTRKIGGVDVYVSSVLVNSRSAMATLKIGSDVKETIVSGDEYAKDSAYEWFVDEASRTIGVILKETYKGFDATEDYNAITASGKLSLPENFVTMEFTGLKDVQYTPIKMDTATKSGVSYIRLKGNFELGIERYDKLYIEVSTDKIYGQDMDTNDLVLLGNKVEVTGTDFELEATATELKVTEAGAEKASFSKDFAVAKLDGFILSGDESHLSTIGIIVSNIEDSADDKVFDFKIPEEDVTAAISFY